MAEPISEISPALLAALHQAVATAVTAALQAERHQLAEERAQLAKERAALQKDLERIAKRRSAKQTAVPRTAPSGSTSSTSAPGSPRAAPSNSPVKVLPPTWAAERADLHRQLAELRATLKAKNAAAMETAERLAHGARKAATAPQSTPVKPKRSKKEKKAGEGEPVDGCDTEGDTSMP